MANFYKRRTDSFVLSFLRPFGSGREALSVCHDRLVGLYQFERVLDRKFVALDSLHQIRIVGESLFGEPDEVFLRAFGVLSRGADRQYPRGGFVFEFYVAPAFFLRSSAQAGRLFRFAEFGQLRDAVLAPVIFAKQDGHPVTAFLFFSVRRVRFEHSVANLPDIIDGIAVEPDHDDAVDLPDRIAAGLGGGTLAQINVLDRRIERRAEVSFLLCAVLHDQGSRSLCRYGLNRQNNRQAQR